jgi:hypothetical protein
VSPLFHIDHPEQRGCAGPYDNWQIPQARSEDLP